MRKSISRIDFARQPRSIKELPRWKATELRQFLLYLGVVVLKPNLPAPFYNNFLCLHVAVKYLASEEWCRVFNEHAHDLLVSYVTQSHTLYTPNFVSHNIHCLLHVGTFDKGALRFYRNHSDGPLPDNCIGQQFKAAERGDMWTVTCSEPDNCVFLSDITVIVVRNFVKYGNLNLVIGQKFKNQNDFYQCPIPCSVIYEFQVSSLSPIIQAWDTSCIKYKAVKLPDTFPHRDSFVVFPLLRQ